MLARYLCLPQRENLRRRGVLLCVDKVYAEQHTPEAPWSGGSSAAAGFRQPRRKSWASRPLQVYIDRRAPLAVSHW